MTPHEITTSQEPSKRPREQVLEEHAALSQLEQASTNMRHQTFTALMSISFLLAGFAFRGPEKAVDPASKISVPGFGEFWPNEIAAVLGLIFYVFTVLHYWWYHRYSHMYRQHLKELEKELDIQVYRNRLRPTIEFKKFKSNDDPWTMKFHFDWSLYIIGILYLFAVGQFSGWTIVIATAALSLGIYGVFLVLSLWAPEEPRETKSAISGVDD